MNKLHTNNNIILASDSYKASHFLQYPEGTTYLHAYLESRGGRLGYTKFFGLQYILMKYLAKGVTAEDVEEARELFTAHGVPFNYDGWMYIVKELGGKIPLYIRAVPEGTVVPNHNVLMTVESTDPNVPWVVGWFESLLLQVWYPISVSTNSYSIKKVILDFFRKTDSEDVVQANIGFKLHDFGLRGVSSQESAELGGMAHLTNFLGTDTVPVLVAAKRYYDEPMAGFSIPAAEHSTITSWGRENEVEAYRNMLHKFNKPGAIVAVVSDSYDLFKAVENLWGEVLKDEVVAGGGTIVIRPDSGEPVTVVLKTMRLLDEKFGSTVNEKGYKVLNNVRVIQGDGINEDSIYRILKAITEDGFSVQNIAFGMGGALLQGVNRDTNAFAYKTSAIQVNGEMRDVFKDPVTDLGKRSKKGVLELISYESTAGRVYETARRSDLDRDLTNENLDKLLVLKGVFLNGEVYTKGTTLSNIRAR